MELAELTTRGFSELLASDAPAPGGGSAAALEGALGAALIAMVCRLTADKPRYREHRETVLAVQEQAEALRVRFLDAMERDTEAFRRVIGPATAQKIIERFGASALPSPCPRPRRRRRPPAPPPSSGEWPGAWPRLWR